MLKELADILHIFDKFESNETHYIVKDIHELTEILQKCKECSITNLPIKLMGKRYICLSLRIQTVYVGVGIIKNAGIKLNDFDITVWDVSDVTNMSYMFSDDKEFNQDISNWNVSNVTSMEGMFMGAINFNQDISGWDVNKVTDMRFMFREARAFNPEFNPFNKKEK